ncbi:MAG: glycine betaine ABC transporter substrate-binding protein [Lactovum sp.]
MKKRVKGISTLIFGMLVLVILSACGKSDVIKITHKNYTEQRLLGQMISVYLEDKGYDTKVSELGGTMLCFNALESGEVDIYVEYTGTLYGAIFEQEKILSAEETYDYIQNEAKSQYGMTLLKELGFNNTYVLSVTKETAEKYDLKSVSDLIPYSKDFLIGSDPEFGSRADGLPGLMAMYEGLEFKDVKSMDQGLTYQAVNSGDIDVNVSYSTDGRIAKFDLVNLEDDKNFFPPYYAVPIMKEEFASENKEVVEALNALEGKWSDEDMQNYNLLVDEGADAKEVATEMLKDKDLIS